MLGRLLDRAGDMRMYPLQQHRVDGRNTHQCRSHCQVARQLCACSVGSQLAHTTPVIDGVVEALHEIDAEHERRTQDRTLQHIAGQHGFGNHPQAAANPIVNRHEAQTVLGIGTGEVRQFMADDRIDFSGIEKPQVHHRHMQGTALEGVARRQ
ncbi:hypothetical protein D3C84_696580 [compost metagenome]